MKSTLYHSSVWGILYSPPPICVLSASDRATRHARQSQHGVEYCTLDHILENSIRDCVGNGLYA